MRPRHLRFSGIRSYRGEARIDFDGHDLFAIIGDTGAGKSTLIEALCFALYARKSWSGDNLLDLMADGCDLMSVEFRFDAQGHTWEVTRARKRRGSPVDKLRSVDEHAPTVDGAREVTRAVERLLGLTCEQFTRAVVMPQGRFDELLTAKPSDRSAILRSILGLDDITATATAAAAIRDALRPLHTRYSERRSMLPADPAGALTAATAGRDDAVERRDILAAAVTAITAPADRRDKIASTVTPLTAALAAVPAPVDSVAVLDSCHARGVELLEELEKVDEDERKAGEDVARIDGVVDAVLDGFASRDELTRAATRVGDAAAALPDDLAALEGARAERARLAGASQSERVDPALVDAVTAAAVAVQGAREQFDQARERHRHATDAVARLSEARTALSEATAGIETKESAVTAAEARRTAATTAADEARAALDAAQAALDASMRADAVASIAAGLSPHDDCPVCARALPADFIAPDVPDTVAANEALIAARTTDSAASSEVTAATAAHATATNALDTARHDVDEKRADVESRTAAVRAAGADPDVDEPTVTLAADVSAADEAVTAAETAERAAQAGLAAAEAEVREALAVHTAAITAADSAVASASTRLDAHAHLVCGLPGGWAHPGDVTVAALQALTDRFATVADRLEELAGERTAANGRVAAADVARERIRADAEVEVTRPASQAITALNDRLNRVRDVATAASACALAAGLDEGTFAGCLTGDLDVIPTDVQTSKLPASIAVATARLDAATAVVDAAAEVESAATDEVSSCDGLIAQALEGVGCGSVAELHGAQGRAVAAVENADQMVARAAAEQAQAADADGVLAEVVPFLENLEVLTASLTNAQFIAHLLSLREQELLAEASRRLKDISSNRFGFVERFGVKNLLSGEIRDPDALSGGERFQASLALALALVEIASRGGGRLDAVFVDEGFGSLDAHALDTALATLGRVAGAGKMVALISHLRPVAEYVDTVMHVVRDDTLGSRITILDADGRDHLLADDIRSGLTV